MARLHDQLGQRSGDGETPFARREQVPAELLPQEQGADRRRAKS